MGRSWAQHPALPLALFAIFEGLTYAAERFAGAPRLHLVNLDYGLALLAVMAVRRFAPRATYAVAFIVLLAAVAIDAFFVASRPIFNGVMRLSDYVAFIDLWPWRALAPWIAGLLAACALVAYPAAQASRGAVPLIMVLIVLVAGDQIVEGRQGPDGQPLDLISSSARNLLRSYVAFVPNGLESLKPFPGPTMATTLAEEPARQVLSVGMESLGVYADEADQAALLRALIAPMEARYRLVFNGVHAYHGLTLQGEVRELCGLSLEGGVRSSADLARFKDCLPNRLASAGYRTVGMHGNPAGFYFRRTAYPAIGFRRTLFIEDLAGRPRCRPDVFNGVCDEAMFQEALAEFAKPGPALVHLMTLNAHPPFPRNDPAPCAGRSQAVQAACAYDQLQRDSLTRLGRALAATRHPPNTVIVFGDHAPIFSNFAAGSDRVGAVPYLVFERRRDGLPAGD